MIQPVITSLPESKESREAADFNRRKNTLTFILCQRFVMMSVCKKFDLNYLRNGRIKRSEKIQQGAGRAGVEGQNAHISQLFEEGFSRNFEQRLQHV